MNFAEYYYKKEFFKKIRKARIMPLYTSRYILTSGHTIQNYLAKLEKLSSLD